MNALSQFEFLRPIIEILSILDGNTNLKQG